MKILRVRRGFTTNSSAAAEWTGQSPDATAAGGASAATPTAQALTPTTAGADASGLTAGTQAAHTPASAQPSPGVGNSVILLGAVGLLAGAFLVERLIRALVKGPRTPHDEE